MPSRKVCVWTKEPAHDCRHHFLGMVDGLKDGSPVLWNRRPQQVILVR